MKKLISLPRNLVHSFHRVANVNKDNWFCASDPLGKPLGSGGGTAWLLDACKQDEESDKIFSEWLVSEKRIILHAGGQSRRLPSYASSGKILTPIPSSCSLKEQSLLSLQLPLYEEIMKKAPASLNTLVACGDVYIQNSSPLQDIPEVDIICYGLCEEAALATNHGVFLFDRKHPETLDFMLQKPSLNKLKALSQSHTFLMDVGIWVLSGRAIELLMERSYCKDKHELKLYDLYSEFGLALGAHPAISDTALNKLSVAILPLPAAKFYHYGTSNELISSTVSIQKKVQKQQEIELQTENICPSVFIQNAMVKLPLSIENRALWIENSVVGCLWKLNNRHIITGVPANNWKLTLPIGVCVNVAPIEADCFVAHPYGFMDTFKGNISDKNTLFMGQPFKLWAAARGIDFDTCSDIQNTPIFPICTKIDELGSVLQWMIAEPELKSGLAYWLSAKKISATEICNQTNLQRLFAQRARFGQSALTLLAKDHAKNNFYHLDLAHTALEFVKGEIAIPEALPTNASPLKQMHNRMFRARMLQLSGKEYLKEQQQAFSILRNELISSVIDEKQQPYFNINREQTVCGYAPARIDLAGGWTDAPPYCIYAGGNVVNVAVELNGQPPLKVYIKPINAYKITLRSIDMGVMQTIDTWDELNDYKKVGSAFSIPKAALALAGFTPDFSAEQFTSLKKQLQAFGCGFEVTLLSTLPAGSGMGTSSILAAVILGAISDFCGLKWRKTDIGSRVLVLEQMITTGGGWQDQYGGMLHGVKLLQTESGFVQKPSVHWLPEHLFTSPEYQSCHLLYYTGITRTAKNILTEIVQGMFLNSAPHLQILSEMKSHALDMYNTIKCGNFTAYGKLIGKSWEQNKMLDSGTNPKEIEHLIDLIKDYALGYKLPGAGGGGYLYIVAKDPNAALQIRKRLTASRLNPNAHFVKMNLSENGFITNRYHTNANKQ